MITGTWYGIIAPNNALKTFPALSHLRSALSHLRSHLRKRSAEKLQAALMPAASRATERVSIFPFVSKPSNCNFPPLVLFKIEDTMGLCTVHMSICLLESPKIFITNTEPSMKSIRGKALI